MGSARRNITAMNRRTALCGMASTALFSVSPNPAKAQTGDALHKQVAAQVRTLMGGKTATLQLLQPEGSGGNLVPVIKAFTEMTGIDVAVTEVHVTEVHTVLMLDTFSPSQKYDIALPATFALPDLVDSEALMPLSDLARKYEPAGFRDGILFDIGDSFDGETYGFQADGDAYLMFYNKAMIENPEERSRYGDIYGEPLEIPRTWEDLDRQMAFFNRPDAGQWGGLLFRTSGFIAWEWWVRFHAKGIWPFSLDMEPQVASDQGVQALEEMIRATEHLCPQSSSIGLFDNWERYSRGDVFCNIGWGGTQKYLMGSQSAMRDNMVYGQTPGGNVDGALLKTPYFNWGWNYVIPSKGDHPELSYLFALFASTPDMSTRAIRETDGFFDPYRNEHYEDARIKAAYSQDFLEIQRASLIGAIPDLYLQNQGEYFRVLSLWLGRALAGDQSPRVALERISHQWKIITDSSDRAQQITRWRQLRGKYPLDLQQRLRDTESS